jgi:hypothetical protein
MGLRQTTIWRKTAWLPFVRYFSLNLGLLSILISFNTFSSGFDMTIYNNIQAMEGEFFSAILFL